MIKISAVIITFNEERHISKCLESLKDVVDEMVVVDSYSTDNTKSIALKYNVKWIDQEFLGYIEQKNFAMAQASYDYILSLDGDEALSETLKKSIIHSKKHWNCDGYQFNRLNNFCGQWINYSDWYPNTKLRLFDRRKAKWSGLNPHDHVVLQNNSQTGLLTGDLLHWTYQSYSEFNKKTEHFSSIAAEAYHRAGKRSSLGKIIWNPFWAFFKSYILRLGFLDGLNGWIICVQMGQITFLKYIKLWEIQNKLN